MYSVILPQQALGRVGGAQACYWRRLPTPHGGKKARSGGLQCSGVDLLSLRALSGQNQRGYGLLAPMTPGAEFAKRIARCSAGGGAVAWNAAAASDLRNQRDMDLFVRMMNP
jgi:hypothetical protein